MGDMADLINAQDFGADEFGPQIQCRYCKRNGFYWIETERGWRLVTMTGRIHQCSKYRVKEDV